MSESTPDSVCGYTADWGSKRMLEEHGELIGPGGVCCWRSTWQDNDFCIWHTEEKRKPADELRNARSSIPERLDYAYLREVEFERDDEISFVNCNIRNSNMRDSKFINIDFSGCNLAMAELHNSKLNHSNFSGARLSSTKLLNSKLIMTDLSNANAPDCQFQKSHLGSSNLSNSNFRNTNFSDCYLANCSFRSTTLRNVDFTDAQISNAVLCKSNLEDAILKRTDIRSANFSHSRLFNAYFSAVRMNSATEFGGSTPYSDIDSLEEWDSTPTEAAIWTYRRLQSLHEEYALPNRARKFHIQKAESIKKRYWEEGRRLRWLAYAMNSILSSHGESPWRVVLVSLGTVCLWTPLYLIFGVFAVSGPPVNAQVVGIGFLSGSQVPQWLSEILLAFYYSSVTFTTLGYGDIQPVNTAAQYLSIIESFAGAFLMALLVFVLGRQTSW
ncbi:pentapeptide repeat-containing protein [Halococcus salsus]|uniref:pentapeptide repeat-containing protein n=1 Tax=Halococcus salsus TaxID=2162894 RepID=UPI00135B4579|nr:pentapeptide repeat-containing protein [Halococcus salsus]